MRLWEALGGSVSRRDTREIHKGLIAYIPATYLLKIQGNRPGDSYRTYCLHSFSDIYSKLEEIDQTLRSIDDLLSISLLKYCLKAQGNRN